jgi:hypothetical protein
MVEFAQIVAAETKLRNRAAAREAVEAHYRHLAAIGRHPRRYRVLMREDDAPSREELERAADPNRYDFS